jgi:ABC-type transporter MlaC component
MRARRCANVLSVAGAIVVLLVGTPARASKAAEAFIQERAGQVMEILNSSASLEHKEAELTGMVDQNVDIARIATYTLGHYRANATADELSQYERAFREYVLHFYVAPAAKFSGLELTVTGSTDVPDKGVTIVRTLAKTAALSEPAELDWQLIDDSSIVDVRIVGISAARVLRAQVLAVLALNGGRVSAATSLLERLVRKR